MVLLLLLYPLLYTFFYFFLTALLSVLSTHLPLWLLLFCQIFLNFYLLYLILLIIIVCTKFLVTIFYYPYSVYFNVFFNLLLLCPILVNFLFLYRCDSLLDLNFYPVQSNPFLIFSLILLYLYSAWLVYTSITNIVNDLIDQEDPTHSHSFVEVWYLNCLVSSTHFLLLFCLLSLNLGVLIGTFCSSPYDLIFFNGVVAITLIFISQTALINESSFFFPYYVLYVLIFDVLTSLVPKDLFEVSFIFRIFLLLTFVSILYIYLISLMHNVNPSSEFRSSWQSTPILVLRTFLINSVNWYLLVHYYFLSNLLSFFTVVLPFLG